MIYHWSHSKKKKLFNTQCNSYILAKSKIYITFGLVKVHKLCKKMTTFGFVCKFWKEKILRASYTFLGAAAFLVDPFGLPLPLFACGSPLWKRKERDLNLILMAPGTIEIGINHNHLNGKD